MKEENIIQLLISIILLTYNRSGLLEHAIKSVLSQTYNNWELIIIDDASGDSTQEFVSQYAGRESRVSYVKNNINLGFVKSLKHGASQARRVFHRAFF